MKAAKRQATEAPIEDGATVVISHKVKSGEQKKYEDWLDKIQPLSRAAAGYLDGQVVRPIANVTFAYTVVLRFDSQKNLEKWINSVERKTLIEEVRPLLVKDDDFFIRSGLDFWFTPQGAKTKLPVRWKQFLMTWSAIFPLVLALPFIIVPVLRKLHFVENHYTDTLVITGIAVFLMVYVIMPHYTKLMRRWLFS